MSDPMAERCEIEDYFDGPLEGVELVLNINYLTSHCCRDIIKINI